MGGFCSEEFLYLMLVGEDMFVCSVGGYVVNVEVFMIVVFEFVVFDVVGLFVIFDFLDMFMIEMFVVYVNCVFDGEFIVVDIFKNVVLVLKYFDGMWEFVIVGIFGDCEVDEKCVEVVFVLVEVEIVIVEDFEWNLLLVKGYIGFWLFIGVVFGEELVIGICYFVDFCVSEGISWIMGVNID